MKFTKLLIALLVIAFSFAACGKKADETKKDTKKEVTKNTKKEVKKETKKEVKAAPTKDGITAAQVKALSDVFTYGDTLVTERKGYQKEISELSRDFKNMKTPFLFKANSKYKHTRVSYFSESVWTTVYANADKKEKDKLFWIIVSYRHSLDDYGRKSYRDKFAGYNAKHFKNSWAWILLKGDIEVKISGSSKETKNDKAMEEILKEFDIKAIESVFTEKTPYPKLKEYLLKIKAINAKIKVVNDKFKAKEKEAVAAFTPFLNTKGFLKDMELGKIYFTTSNSFSVYLRKDKKSLATLYVGRPDMIGALSYFRSKNVVNFKVEGFDSTSLKDNLVIVKLPTVAVKVTSYLNKEFAKVENLKKVASSVFLKSLSKVK